MSIAIRATIARLTPQRAKNFAPLTRRENRRIQCYKASILRGTCLALTTVSFLFCHFTNAVAAESKVQAIVSSCRVSRKGSVEIAASVMGGHRRIKQPVFAIFILGESRNGQRFCFTRIGVPDMSQKGQMIVGSPRMATYYDDRKSGTENPVYFQDAAGVKQAFEVVSRAQPQVDATALRSMRVSGSGDFAISMSELTVVCVRVEVWHDSSAISVYAPPPSARAQSLAIPSDWHVFQKHKDSITYSIHSHPIL